MIPKPKRIQIPADSEIARLLDEAAKTPVLLEREGELFRLSKETEHPLTEEAYEAFRSAAGGWADVDTERLKKVIYESRQLSTRPPVQL